ncbi:DNA mismatch repair protein Msh6 [Lingula anatina]|uniref:DNA mismatch repair protein n=1 Tax=Lingula anatina TaxID=7574 RepID=A0A1S3HIT5_LINAN|nr:DNA mismatch repair protein Msh6 [Lingula anatina]|eukprot:XP_013386030.1 DNA mismatch repair protein Msh6 [Lingula anatina]
MSKAQNSILSYFSKTPKSEKTQNKEKNVLTPKQTRSSPNRSGSQGDKKEKATGKVAPGDVVWAKLEGYPWWPSLVCNHPTLHTCTRTKGRNTDVHVQFFDNPPSRAWVKEKYVKPFTGSDSADFQRGGQFFSADPQCRKGATEADKAVASSVADRLKLVVDLQPSSDEEEEEEEGTKIDDIDWDDEIFDNEADNSKENHEEEEVGAETKSNKKKTPQKPTPKKNGRPSRGSKAKRRRIRLPSDDSEDSGDEYKPAKSENESESEDSAGSGVDEADISEPETESDTGTPVKNSRKRKRGSVTTSKTPGVATKAKENLSSFANTTPSSPLSGASTPLTPLSRSSTPHTPVSVSDKTKSKLMAWAAPDTPPETSAPVSEDGTVYMHYTLDFLKPEKIKDIEGRRPDHTEYDPRTLYVPDTFKKKLTPAMKQWWEIKSKHFDTVLFFKVGKFYELYHMDAVIGVTELGLMYMKGNFAHSGFPEIAYSRYADTLIQKGYKAARVEQMESQESAEEKAAGKANKLMQRELCRITSKGTKTFNFMDGDSTESGSDYLLAIAEKNSEESSGGESTYGVCFVDTSIGKFHIGQFSDDRHGSRLRTLVSHFRPAEILYERGHISQKMQQIFNGHLTSALKEALTSGTEFWDSSKTLKFLSEGDYFLPGGENSEKFQWPQAIKAMISETDSLGLTASDEYELAIKALGAITWYLCRCCIDQELLSMKQFEEYTPLDQKQNKKGVEFASGKQKMVLDSVTLFNLEVMENSVTGTTEGTLLERLDQCVTPFGKRLFRQWLCAPLCNPSAIDDRLDAVEDLMAAQDVVTEVMELMKKLPDLERLLSKIHTLGNASRSKNHPDSRAIFYDDVTYSKKKIEDFLATLNGFKATQDIVLKFKGKGQNFKSRLLRQLVTVQKSDTSNSAKFPDLVEKLRFFDQAFDQQKAKAQGVIVPSKGVDPEYDQSLDDIKSTQAKLDTYLDQQRQRLGCRSLQYWGTGKNRYQLEVPEGVLQRVPDEYEFESQKKGFKRYRTKRIMGLLAEMEAAETRKVDAQKDCMRRIFNSFDENYTSWHSAVQCMAVLDVLINMAAYSRCGDGVMCRPQLVLPEDQDQPFLELREARHPCISATFSGGDFIPNDTVIGCHDDNAMETDGIDHSDSSIVLVTGPNMGGKSTLMRQVGVIVIMAQLGVYVPAEKCRLTPVDRVFTRLGASDRIMSGESTFYVELSETSAILQHATRHSLVLLDELGRGTATYDGTAIACAVVRELSQNVRSRTLFSTHYHSLVEEFTHDPNIRLGHMACMVENENDEDPSQETITFLYKFVSGACPKSYGFNAARLADIPEQIIKVARIKAQEFEEHADNLKVFRNICSTDEALGKDSLISLQNQIQVS